MMRLLRLPLSMWIYGGIGAALIIWSGAKIILAPSSRR